MKNTPTTPSWYTLKKEACCQIWTCKWQWIPTSKVVLGTRGKKREAKEAINSECSVVKRDLMQRNRLCLSELHTDVALPFLRFGAVLVALCAVLAIVCRS